MRIVFLGTPELAVPSLELLAKHHTITAVVCQPDKPQGRSAKLVPPPVKIRALELGIPVHQPAKLNDGAFEVWLKEQAPEACALVAYGRILKEPILAVPLHGILNLHPSLLPKYRGPSPIQSAILAGETETGITIMRIEMETDSGAILLQRPFPIAPDDTTASLADKLAHAGAKLLAEGIDLVAQGKAVFTPQDHARATHCRMISKEDARVDWRMPAQEINNRVRAFVPWPVAHAILDGEILRIYAAHVLPGASGDIPGTIIEVTKESIVVATGSGRLAINRLQAPGKKPMNTADFLRGRRIAAGTSFEVV